MGLSSAQIEQRKTGLGCSELFDILVKPYSVWHQKITGKSRFTGDEDFIRFGNGLERVTADDYTFRRGKAGFPVRLFQTTTETGEGVTLPHPTLPWLMGTPDFLPVLATGGLPTHLPDLAAVHRLMDAGLLDRGLEIKTGAAVAETHLDEADRWGNSTPPDLVDFLAPHCADPAWLARALMGRYSLQTIVGSEAAELAEDEWGDADSSQMPRRYVVQCLGYMSITGLRRWDLHRLRFGWGRLETATYRVEWDGELVGNLLDAGARFVRDHLLTGKPPEQRTLEEMQQETARLFPRDNGILLPLDPERSEALEALREAVIAAKRAEIREDAVKEQIKRLIGDASGIDGGKGFKVTWSAQDGRRTVNAEALAGGIAARLTGLLPGETITRIVAEATAEATKQGEAFRVLRRPPAWTKGIEAEVLASLTEG